MNTARPDTWMPLYWGDYHRDTGHLGAAEHGGYLLLIGHYWATGKPLPDNDILLARIARMTTDEWAAARRIIEPFFQVSDGLWRHKRINEELAKWQRLLDAKSAAGKASAATRAQRNANRRSTNMATEGATKSNPSPSPSPIPIPSESAPKTAHELQTALVWETCPERLDKLGLSEKAARSNLGRWLKTAPPDRVLKAVDAAARCGTRDPIPYVTEALKDTRPKRNGERFVVKRGSEQFEAWERWARRTNSSMVYSFTARDEVDVPSMWPKGV